MRKVKVAFLDYSFVFAGAERVLFNMIAHIDRSKYEPILVFPYPMEHQKRYLPLDCDKVYLADRKKWWMGSDKWEHSLRGTDFIKRSEFGRRIAGLIKRKHIDILDVNLMRMDVMMWVWATRKFTNARIVGHYRSQSQDWVAPAKAQRLFDVIACVSEFSRMRFRLKGDFTKTVVLYDSVDVDIMKCKKTKSEAKRELGFTEDTLLLTSVGQLSPHKGHDNAIKAFAKIAARFPQARLFIAGGGSKQLVDMYKKIATDCGIANKVTITGQQYSDIQTVYRATDLTLSLTKVGEGFGLVPYESALMGTPFIAPCFGAVCEFVTDGENGILVDTNNVNEVSDKIAYALDSLEQCGDMVKKLDAMIHDKLHPTVLAKELDKLYTSLLSK